MYTHKTYAESLDTHELIELHASLENIIQTDMDEDILSADLELLHAVYEELESRGYFAEYEPEYEPWTGYEEEDFDPDDYPF